MEPIFKPGDLVEYIPEAFGHKDKYIGTGYVEKAEFNESTGMYFYTVVSFNTVKQSAKNFAEYHIGEVRRMWHEHVAQNILRKIS